MLRIGYVPDVELPALYSGATAVVVPSLYEGFGLPAVEAMACGAPVIALMTCFPETTSDAAFAVNPESAPEIAAAMKEIRDNEQLAASLRARGLVRAQQLSWQESARKLESLVEQVQ